MWAAVEFLEKRRPGRPLIVSGNSMGSAAAVFAAKELGHRVQGYILESPYQDLKVAVWNRLDNSLPRGSEPYCLRRHEDRRTALPSSYRADFAAQRNQRNTGGRAGLDPGR